MVSSVKFFSVFARLKFMLCSIAALNRDDSHAHFELILFKLSFSTESEFAAFYQSQLDV